MYALIKNGIVENIIVADAEFASSIASQWDSVVQAPETCSIGWLYTDGVFSAPLEPEPLPPVADPAEWFIDLGPFYDRFGAAKMAVLTSTDAAVKAILADVSIRKWVDLQRADVAQSLAYVGSVVPELTPALQTSILTTPVSVEENRALKRLYF